MASKRAVKAVRASFDFAFFDYLWHVYRVNRGTIRSHYKEPTRKYLDFNNLEKTAKAFLRQPQRHARETYVFLIAKDRDRLRQYPHQLAGDVHLMEERKSQKVSRMHMYCTGEKGGNPYISFTKRPSRQQDYRSVRQHRRAYRTL
jgi:hypothetical protein